MLIRDAYPVSMGHSLVIPKRHIGSWFEVSLEERTAMLALLDLAKATIDQKHQPDSYNIGINDGPADLRKKIAQAHLGAANANR